MVTRLKLSRLFLSLGTMAAAVLLVWQGFVASSYSASIPGTPAAGSPPAARDSAASAGNVASPDPTLPQLDKSFADTIHPFLDTYCFSCHSGEKPEAGLDLSTYGSTAAVLKDSRHALLVIQRLKADQMPPKDAQQPAPQARAQAVAWFGSAIVLESRRNAGDPGIVLARRLSNAEYDYTIRDLTGVDLRPTREFPVDPGNTAGFDNSGESLVMSPTLLNKYLAAARDVADHMFLKPQGFAFAPYPMLVETDRDKYCVMQIIDYYHQQDTDYADYFQAAWAFKHRVELGKPQATLAQIAAERKVSAKYLTKIWTLLEETKADVGPLVKLQALWRNLPVPVANQTAAARPGCEQMRSYVVGFRKKVEPRFLNITAGSIGAASGPFLIWKNVQYATHRMMFDPAQLQVAGEPRPAPSNTPEPETSNPFGPGATRLVKNAQGDQELVVPAGQRARYEAAFATFCAVFPDMFYKQERGRNYFDTSKDLGRYLSAGFHNRMGYFRDDQPLYELILDDQQQKELDEMWREMDFVASANIRTYIQFVGDGARQLRGVADDTDPPPSGDPIIAKDITSEAKIMELKASFLAQARGGSEVGIKAINDYFNDVNASIRWVEKARIDAVPSHLQALQDFAARAYRRPLTQDEKEDLLAFYKACREKDGMDHEAAMRECIVSILLSPNLTYRVDLVSAAPGIHPLSDYDLASRLSYFLWSSLPDQELLRHAAAGDLHKPEVIAAQARRMIQDPRIGALAVEFGGNWLDFRRFEDLNTVDRERFTSFTPELREAMFEEPVHFLVDVFQRNRSVLDLLYAKDTFVNAVLARHYGIPVSTFGPDGWAQVMDADKYDRGGILPMAVFLTKNAPGLRTSPVKRGNWVVKNVLGEKIPPPPAVVPELPHDEAKMDLPLRDMLARHRSDPNCMACHARFDAMGLVFEGFGPIGERRTKDLAGRAIDASATFPGGSEGSDITGLQKYIHDFRQDDFVDNLCGKLLAYSLGRSLMLSDDPTIQAMHKKLAADDYRLEGLVESIVTSQQFLNKRGGETPAER